MAVLLFKAFTAVLLISFGFSMVHGYSLTVLHTNDHHGRFEETDTSGGLCFPRLAKAGECFGGVARRATMIKKIRAEEKNVLLLSGGDVFTGTLWYLAYRGNASRKFMNELGYDAMVYSFFSTLIHTGLNSMISEPRPVIDRGHRFTQVVVSALCTCARILAGTFVHKYFPKRQNL